MSPRYSRPIVLAAVALMSALAFGGCSREANATSSAAPTNPDEKRYALTGEIVRADLERKVLLVTHDEIKGYMPAMTMEFQVTRGDLENAKPGQRIRAELVERKNAQGEPDYFLEKIWPDDSVTVRALDASAKALAQDTATRGKGVYREVGEAAPDFTLLDQEGRAVAVTKFRGKKVMMNFIFTRCPIATMCPAATQKMSALQQAAKEAGVTDVEFVSVSLDPEYDTPGVLKEYAQLRGLDLSNWSFLTGPDAAVRHLLAQMGIIREFEGATIKHNLATLLIDPSGRIIHRVDGSRWDTQEFLPKMKR